MRAVASAWLVAVAVAASTAAVAAPAEELDAARAAFRRGDFKGAVPVLSHLLYPTPRLADSQDLIEAHVLLGVCSFETGDRTIAFREFEEALFLQADLALDPLLFSRGAIELFDTAKAQVAERSKRDAERRSLAEEKERLRRYRESLIVYEVRPYYINFVPFGAGQFQNGQRGKGLAFFSTQVATGAASLGIWAYLVGKYGYGGQVPADEAATVRRLEQVQIGTGIACLGLVAWGVVDSLVNYRPRVKVEGDDSLLPEDVRPHQPAKDGPHAQVLPHPLPGGAGVAVAWEF